MRACTRIAVNLDSLSSEMLNQLVKGGHVEYRSLGNSGLQVSLSGIGTNPFGLKMGEAEVTAVVNEALDQGVTLFDTADHYSEGAAETLIGKALGRRRHEAVIASKFGWNMEGVTYQAKGSRHYMHWAVEQSLRRLNTDYIDLYQYHRPDNITPIEETLDALDDLVRAGKVRYVGCSNFEGWRIADAHWTARSRSTNHFVSAQNRWSLMSRDVEADVIPACERFGLGMLPYSPLMGGMLTGKYKRGQEHPQGSRLALFKEAATNPDVLMTTDRHWPFRAPEFERRTASDANFDVVERLTAYAEERGHTTHELAIGWLASKPVVSSVIAGATTPEQVRANAAAVEAWRLSAEESDEVAAVLRGDSA